MTHNVLSGTLSPCTTTTHKVNRHFSDTQPDFWSVRTSITPSVATSQSKRVVAFEIKLKQNNFTETKHCFAFVLFQIYFSFISDVTTGSEKDCTNYVLDHMMHCPTGSSQAQGPISSSC